MSFIRTKAINKLLKMTGNVRVVKGGTSAGKTYGILPILINLAAKEPGREISIVSESIPHLRRGAMKDFLKIMKDTGRFFEERWNKTLLTYTFANGSYIEFFSADQESKVRGPRRTDLYINEVNNITFDVFDQLYIRTLNTVWVDFNPVAEFWADTELADAEWLTLTYKDNEALLPSQVEKIESRKLKAFYDPNLTEDQIFKKENIKSEYWSNWWKVYGLGLTGTLQGVVLDNWSLIDNVDGAKLLAVGVDFGYTNDPTAVVAVYEKDWRLIYDEIIYKTGMHNSEIAKLIPNGVIAYCDSAEPKTIADLCLRGVAAKPVVKGKDSVNYGIELMQERSPFFVTKRSVNLIKELRNYCWEKDASGKLTNKPVGEDHAIDAARYATMMLFGSSRAQTKARYI